MKLHHKHNLGFSVLEMVVVTSIIMVSFIAILMIVERTIKMRSLNQNYLVAVELAQEGLELVRYVRNDNWLMITDPDQTNVFDFDANINDQSTKRYLTLDYRIRSDIDNRSQNRAEPPARTDGKQYIDTLSFNTANAMEDEIKNSAARLYLETDVNGNNFYIINDGSSSQPTNFYRLIKTIYHDNDTNTSNPTSYQNDDDYMEVVVKIYWQDRGRDYYYTTSTYLYDYDWYY